jgi:DNA-binding HxlR family transcriptional regulator
VLRTCGCETYLEVSVARTDPIRQRALQSREAVELIADKWRIPILHVLSPAPLRTGELQLAIEEISPKVLTQTLRGMERDGLVTRTVYPVVPPRVEYALTDMGRSLLQPLHDLCLWAKAHCGARDRARQDFDAARSAQD